MKYRRYVREPIPPHHSAMTKPRIIKITGVWHCGIYGEINEFIGLGFTPLQAYNDWALFRAGREVSTHAQ